MSDTIISWKFENMVSITLMALLGFTAIGVVLHLAGKMKGGTNENT